MMIIIMIMIIVIMIIYMKSVNGELTNGDVRYCSRRKTGIPPRAGGGGGRSRVRSSSLEVVLGGRVTIGVITSRAGRGGNDMALI